MTGKSSSQCYNYNLRLWSILFNSELFEKDDDKAADVKTPVVLTLSQRELAQTVERMGDLLLGVKTLFDCKCEAGEAVVSPEDAAGMLLDLCLSNEVFVAARAELTTKMIDFAGFLQIYARHCGLLDSSKKQSGHSKRMWIPSKDGMWSEVEEKVAEAVRRAAVPLVVSAAESSDSRRKKKDLNVFLLPSKAVDELLDEKEDTCWVPLENLSDLLTLAGTLATSESVDACINAIKHFLPGVLSGTFCLQVRPFVQLFSFLISNVCFHLKLFSGNTGDPEIS